MSIEIYKERKYKTVYIGFSGGAGGIGSRVRRKFD